MKGNVLFWSNWYRLKILSVDKIRLDPGLPRRLPCGKSGSHNSVNSVTAPNPQLDSSSRTGKDTLTSTWIKNQTRYIGTMTQKILQRQASLCKNKLHEDERQVLRLMLQVNKFDVQNFYWFFVFYRVNVTYNLLNNRVTAGPLLWSVEIGWD